MDPKKARSSVAYSVHAKMNFRVIVVGDSAVGKTSLILRYVKGVFNKNKTYVASIGVEFYSKMMEIEGEEVAIQVWDTAGQENFKSIAKSFYNKASCVIIAYSNPLLLAKTLQNYTFQINQHALDGVRTIVARTQIDEYPLTAQQTALLEIEVMSKKIDFWMGVSAKSGENVEKFFSKMAEELYKRYLNDQHFRQLVNPKKDSFFLDDQAKDIIASNTSQKRQKKRCC